MIPDPSTGLPTGPGSFLFSVPVRFRDVDAGGHVHHSHVLAYLEEARLAWWARVTGRPRTLEAVDHILAEIQVRYRARIHWPDLLTVELRVAVVGRVHLELDQQVWRTGRQDAIEPGAFPGGRGAGPRMTEREEGGPPQTGRETPERVAEGRVVILPYDYARSTPVPITDALRARIEAEAGGPLPRRRPKP